MILRKIKRTIMPSLSYTIFVAFYSWREELISNNSNSRSVTVGCRGSFKANGTIYVRNLGGIHWRSPVNCSNLGVLKASKWMFLICFDHNNIYKPKWAPELREPKLIKQCPNHSRILLIVDSIKGNVFCNILTISAVAQEIN